MIIFPAIDIKDGSVVRLLQGEFNSVTEYSKDPLTIAEQWRDQGAQWLHIVDLDGAKTGQPKNIDIILEIAKTIKIPIQMGGGVRKIETIEKLLSNGISRVILGTKGVEDIQFLECALKMWKDKIVVSLDCKDGYLTSLGWTSTLKTKALDFVKALESMGVSCLIYTDIATDGMLAGPNISAFKELLKETNIPVIASGGVSNLEDIKALKSLECEGIMGAISGKAIYEGKLKLQEAIEMAK